MRIGYLMPTYPMVSSTFIPREIRALEGMGVSVRRFAVRPWAGGLPDPSDRREKAETTYLLPDRAGLLRGAAWCLRREPRGVLRALRFARSVHRRSRAGMVRIAAWVLEAMALRRQSGGLEHLHVHFSTNATAVAAMARMMGGPPYSFTVHGPDELLAPDANATADKVAGAAFVACISHFARSQVMLAADASDWDRLRIVHCGVDPDRYAPQGPQNRRGDGDAGAVHIAFVGRLSGVKGASLLLDALAALAPRHPALRLTMAGDGPERPALEARARELGLADRVRFPGFVSQDAVTALLGEADMLVLPSFAEGVPVVLMEAMACALPVVTTRIAGIAELVEDGTSGLLVPPGDMESLTAALARLIADPHAAAAMGRAGRATVERDFRLDREAAWLRTIIAGSLAGALPPTLRPPGDDAAA